MPHEVPAIHDRLLEFQRLLQEADDIRSMPAFRSVAADVLELLGSVSKDERPPGSERLQLLLVERLALELLEDEPELSIQLCGLGRELAASAKGEFWRRIFCLLGVQGCTKLLDLESAAIVLLEEVMLEIEGPRAFEYDQWASACEQYGSVLAPSERRTELHSLTLVTAARWAAALGRFRLAERLLERALSIATESSAATRLEVALRLGEVRLDLGRFEILQELRALVVEGDLSSEDLLRWELFWARALRAQGRLADARAKFMALSSQAIQMPGTLAASVRVECLLQEASLLVTLNRIEDAERLLEMLDGFGPSCAAEVASLRAHLDHRRGGVDRSSPFESRLPWLSFRKGPRSEPKTKSPEQRRTERFHDDICRVLNLVLEALRTDDPRAVEDLLDTAHQWAQYCDSDLIIAEYDLIESIAAQIGGNGELAMSRCERSLEMFEGMGAVELQWTAARALGWILPNNGAALAELEENQRYQGRVLDVLHGGLSAEDRIYHMLSRWTQNDLRVQNILARHAHELSLGRRSQWTKMEAVLAAIEHHRTWDHLMCDSLLDRELGHDASVRIRQRGSMSAMVGTRRHWLPARSAVLRYLSLPDRLEGFLFWKGHEHRLHIDPRSGRPELRRRIDKFLKYMRLGWDPGAKVVTELSRILGFSEVHEILPSEIEDLILIPEGLLLQVPYAALSIEGSPLLDRFAPTVVVHHESTWTKPRRLRRRSAMTGIGVENAPSDGNLAPLPSVRDELNALKAVNPTSACLSGENATRAAVQRSLQQGGLVHLACHGRFQSDSPLDSGIALHDGWLTISDVSRGLERSAATLVSMSTCWGANMEILPGNEIVSMPTTLLDLGVEWVIASLLEVHDRDNPYLVERLYSELPRASPAVALARAQRACLHEGRPAREWGCYLALRNSVTVRFGRRWLARLRARFWPLHRGIS